MSLPIFEDLTSRYPDERRAITELAEIVGAERHREMTFDHLVARLQPESVEDLASILAELTHAGAIKRFFRVESPTSRGGIGDFPSLDAIPPKLPDTRAEDEEIVVTPDRLRVFYTVD